MKVNRNPISVAALSGRLSGQSTVANKLKKLYKLEINPCYDIKYGTLGIKALAHGRFNYHHHLEHIIIYKSWRIL